MFPYSPPPIDQIWFVFPEPQAIPPSPPHTAVPLVFGNNSFLIRPTNGSTGILRPVVFRWRPVKNVFDYTIQVATDELFTNIIIDERTTALSYEAAGLSPSTQYFWRMGYR